MGIEVTDLDDHVIKSYRIFPNPSKGTVNITSNKAVGDVEIVIKDKTGRVFLEKRFHKAGNSLKFNLSGVSTGLYFIHIKDDFKTVVEKLVIID